MTPQPRAASTCSCRGQAGHRLCLSPCQGLPGRRGWCLLRPDRLSYTRLGAFQLSLSWDKVRTAPPVTSPPAPRGAGRHGETGRELVKRGSPSLTRAKGRWQLCHFPGLVSPLEDGRTSQECLHMPHTHKPPAGSLAEPGREASGFYTQAHVQTYFCNGTQLSARPAALTAAQVSSQHFHQHW